MKMGCRLSTGNLRKTPPKIRLRMLTVARFTPMAEIIMKRRGALRARRGLYASFSVATERMMVRIIEIIAASQKGMKNELMAVNAMNAPNAIKPSNAQLVKLYTLYTSAYPTASRE